MDAKLKIVFDKVRNALSNAKLERAVKEWDLVKPKLEKITDAEKVDKIVEFYTDETIVECVKYEQHQIEIDDALPTFKFDELLLNWLTSNPFFLELSRWIRKRAVFNKPTASMCYNTETDDFELHYNPRWFVSIILKDPKDGVKRVEGVLCHEFYHNVFRHVTTRRREPFYPWNLATDGAIDSLIVSSGGLVAPGMIVPGEPWSAPTCGRKLTPQEEMMAQLSDHIKSWPKLMASEWYFESLMKWSEETGNKFGKKGMKPKGGSGGGGGEGEEGEGDEFSPPGQGPNSPSHDSWDSIPEEYRKLAEEKMKNILRKASRKAENTQNGWGNIPAEIRELIRRSVDGRINWKSVLANFVGMFTTGKRSTSIKRINRRYPYIHPGVKKGRIAHIAVAVDQSGSVDDVQLQQIFGVLGSLAKRVNFTVIPFDHTVDEENIFEWKKGKLPEIKRTRAGGTSFECVCNYVNHPSRRGKWDGLLICTDGECSDPGPSRIKRGWVATPNHKLLFSTNELVVSMDETSDVPNKGVIR